MSRRLVVLFIILVLWVAPLSEVPGAADSGQDDGQELTNGSVRNMILDERWSDSFDDTSKVHMPQEGLDGVEVADGEVRLLQGDASGWLASIVITCPSGTRYDYLEIDAEVPGNSTVLFTIMDPSQASTIAGYVNETIPGYVDRTSRRLSLIDLSPDDYPEIRLQMDLLADGAVRPRVFAWSLHFCDCDLWYDPFLGLDRDTSHGNLVFDNGTVRPGTGLSPGGLYGEYFDNMDFTDLKHIIQHDVVDYDWDTGDPIGIDGETFSVRWTGAIEIKTTETYTFYMRTDDGIRLWVDHQLIIDEWNDHSPREFNATMDMVPGIYDVKIEFYENHVYAVCEFRYSSPTIPKQIVPAEALFSGGISALISDPISVPPGHKWDYLKVSREAGEGGQVYVSVVDTARNRTIADYTRTVNEFVDLSDLDPESYGTIHLRATWNAMNETLPPGLSEWMVTWVENGRWQERFYCEGRPSRLLNLDVNEGVLRPFAEQHVGPTLIFTNLWNDTEMVKSAAYLDGGSLDYLSREPISLNATGASSVDLSDINGDGFLDALFSIYMGSMANYSAMSPIFMGSAKGWPLIPHHSFPTTGAMDVLMEDLNGDGYIDVVFAQEQDDYDYTIKSTLFWGSPQGWSSTPDVMFSTTGAMDVETADLDNDGDLDLVFACYMSTTTATDSMVFLQTPSGFDGSSPSHRLPTKGAKAVATGDLNGDSYEDVVFANSISEGVSETDSWIYFWSPIGGYTLSKNGLPTVGASDVAVEDLDGDGHLDIVFANAVDDWGACDVDSYIYMNDGTGEFSSGPEFTVPTIGAEAVAVGDIDGSGWMDLVFSSFTDGVSHCVPSFAFFGRAGNWSSTPDIELPTMGAMDIEISNLAEDTGLGAYLSRTITPEDVRATGSFHTFGYEADLDGQHSGSIQLIDAYTFEVLAETTLQQGSNEWKVEGAFRVRDHPNIRVHISLEGIDQDPGTWLDNLWINWTDRVWKDPEVLDIRPGKTSVHRTQPVQLYVTVSDDYDDPEDLMVKMHHKVDSSTVWMDYLMRGKEYTMGCWTFDLLSLVDDPLGTYRFRIQVTDLDGMKTGYIESPNTLEILPNLPTAPLNLSANATDGKVELEWQPPQTSGDEMLGGYRVLKGPGEEALASIATVLARSTTYTDTTVTNGVTYYYAVVAFISVGQGELSKVVEATPRGPPGAPQELTAEVDEDSITLRWEPPSFDGGSPVLGYHLFRGTKKADLEWYQRVEGTSYLDEGLSKGVTLYYAVLAYNLIANGTLSPVTHATPVSLPGVPIDVIAEEGNGTVRVYWGTPLDPGGLELTKYYLYRGATGDDMERLTELEAVTLAYMDRDVIAGMTYHYAISAVNAMGEGPMSLSVSATPYGTPGIPNGLFAKQLEVGVELSWSPPTSDGSRPIMGYILVYGFYMDNLDQSIKLGIATSCIVGGLDGGRTYYFAVAAVNEMGSGDYTTAVSASIPIPSQGPSRVMDIKATSAGSSITIVWLPPEDNGGMPLLGYTIMRGRQPTDMEVLVDLGSVLSYIDEDLEEGKTYYYCVIAHNAVGKGEAGETVMIDAPTVRKADEPGFGSGMITLALVGAMMISIALRRRRKT